MNPLHELIRKLPARVEFLVVITWAFGLAIFASILSIGMTPQDANGLYNNSGLIGDLIFELVQSLFIIWFLRIRGWTLEKLRSERDLARHPVGVGLLAITYGLWIGVQYLAQWFMPEQMQAAEARYPTASPDLSMSLVFVASVVNGIFEEVFVAGYVIAAMGPVRGMWAAINVSTGIRLMYPPVPGADRRADHRADGTAVRLHLRTHADAVGADLRAHRHGHPRPGARAVRQRVLS